MTALTTNLDIVYPTSTDAPCSLDDTISAAILTIDRVMSTISGEVDLTARRPCLILHSFDVTVQTYGSNEPIPWQAVIYSDGFPIDLVRDSSSFYSPVDGAYLGGGRLEVAGTGVAGTEIYLSPNWTYATSQGCRDSSGVGNTAMCCFTSIDKSSDTAWANAMYTFPVSATTSLYISDAYAWFIRIGNGY